MGHKRLAITDPESGSQPLVVGLDESVTVAANGEIYDYKELYKELQAGVVDYTLKTGSDCKVHNIRRLT